MQTTRHSIIGVQTKGDYQFVYVDTPGIHQRIKKTMNRMMNKTAISVLKDVDVIAFIVDAMQWKEEDEFVLNLIKKVKTPCFLLINKIDKIKDKSLLLPYIEKIQHQYDFKFIIPISAKNDIQLAEFQHDLQAYLPPGPHLFRDDQVTDRPIKFLCSELLREKIFRLTGEEIPYSVAIEIESFEETEKLVTIHALILVDKESHKKMIIGEKGNKLKEIATSARLDMQKLLEKKVLLKCWCKIKTGWTDNKKYLKQLGYDH